MTRLDFSKGNRRGWLSSRGELCSGGGRVGKERGEDGDGDVGLMG